MDAAGQKIRVCIADDHHLVASAMVKLIKTFTRVNEVMAVADGKRLLDAIPSFKPDVILLDVRMPVMDGLEAGKIILNQY